MATEMDDQQRAVCVQYGAAFNPPTRESRVGIALQTLERVPLHGLRVPVTSSVCGWYLWAGDERYDDPDFFQPLCIEHLPERCPLAVPFLALPPGWRFLTDGDHTDVWYDSELLKGSSADV